MKSERLLNLMEGADEKFILEAMPDFESTSEGSEKKNESRRGKILIIVSAAASFLIIASSSLYTGFQANNNSNRSPEAENPALVLTETADEYEEADEIIIMIQLFQNIFHRFFLLLIIIPNFFVLILL